MIDFIKLLNIPLSHEKVLKNNILDFDKIEKKRSTNVEKYIAEYHDLKIQVVNKKEKNYVNVQGSLHEFWNNGSNHDDFNYSMLFCSIAKLWLLFGINPYKTYLNNLEFGINIKCSFSPQLIIDSLISYKNEPFIPWQSYPNIGAIVKRQRYWIKIYDKGLQSEAGGNILRVEIHVSKMEHLKTISIKTLSDLLCKAKLEKLGMMLIESFNAIFMINPSIDFESLDTNNKILYLVGKDAKKWQTVYKNNRQEHDKQKKKFQSFIKEHSKNDDQKMVSKLLQNKLNDLLFGSSNRMGKLTDMVFSFNEFDFNKIDNLNEQQFYEIVAKLTGGVDINTVRQINYLDNGLNNTNDKNDSGRKCKTCDGDISHRRKGAVFCENRKCRNKDSDLRRKVRKQLAKNADIPVLFDKDQYLVITPQYQKILNTKRIKYGKQL